MRAALPRHDDVTQVRPIVRCRSARELRREGLERRLSIARDFIHAHRSGRDPSTLARLDEEYQSTRLPLLHGESYDEA